MADHHLKLWDGRGSIAVSDKAGRPVTKMYVEAEGKSGYVEIEIGPLEDLRVGPRLISVRYQREGASE